MEIFIRNIDPSATVHKLKRAIADVLHAPSFDHFQALPINFEAVIYPQGKIGQLRCGSFTVPTCEIGREFLKRYGTTRSPQGRIYLGNRQLSFSASRDCPRPELVASLLRLPYVDPRALEEHELLATQLRQHTIAVSLIQFGWHCRDGAFSVEHERPCTGSLVFDLDRREYQLKHWSDGREFTVAMRASQTLWTATGVGEEPGTYALFFCLQHAPTFISEYRESRQRVSSLDSDHALFTPYTSLAIRFICRAHNVLGTLNWIGAVARVKMDNKKLPAPEYRELFCTTRQTEYAQWLSTLDWPVAFQIDALAQDNLMDLKELLDLRRHVAWLVSRKGTQYAADFIRHLNTHAREPFWYRSKSADPVRELWLQCRRTFRLESPVPSVPENEGDTFPCLHVIVTPTTVYLDGPFPERTNRILRKYSGHPYNFLRVNFLDEGGVTYRVDRDVDDRAFIHRRFGHILRYGIIVAGRHFEYLAYSQSGLKQHAVWFMSPFETEIDGAMGMVTPDSLIASIGNFQDVESDPDLIYCPARYGARISQAFTATEAAISVEIEEIIIIDDINDRTGRSFTDGIGTLSPDFAIEFWQKLQSVSRRHAQNHDCEYPPAFQIRCQGSKGMLSVDCRLSGRQLCLRPSMIKFEAPQSRHVEIVTAFTKPGKFQLNRPLLMMFEGLEIQGGYKILKQLQEAVVAHTKRAAKDFTEAASLMESFGLGTAFKLTSLFTTFGKLDVDVFRLPFYRQLIEYAVYHVRRELKFHARIPVPDSWTLPGVADIHGILNEGQIFVCVVPHRGAEPMYLKGPVMVFRSPTIHPGDIQVVYAIGSPPTGSPLAEQPLANTVVFATKGHRPLASCLAGGDLDGDVFVCSTLKALLPTKLFAPAEYTSAERKTVPRPSTRQDVADFVTEYLYSDSVGIIASNWLLHADQGDHGISDPNCLLLAQYHSDAVDYPKTGKPVPIHKIPRPRARAKPDWSAPEVSLGDNRLYYESQRWLGKLFREIQMPDHLPIPQLQPWAENRNITLDQVYDCFIKNNFIPIASEHLDKAIRDRLGTFISPWSYIKAHIVEIVSIFHDYTSNFRAICTSTASSSGRPAILTEVEAIVGTILGKHAIARRRKDLTAQMREQTGTLFHQVAKQIVGRDEQIDEEDFVACTTTAMKRAWVGYRVAMIYEHLDKHYFGARSFGILCLVEVFDAVRKLENFARLQE